MFGNIKSFKRIINQLACILTIKQKKESLGVFASMILVSLLELLSVSIIYPFLEAMITPETMREKWYISWVFLVNPRLSNKSLIVIIGIFIISIFLIKNGLELFFSYIQFRFAGIFLRDASSLMLESYMKRPYQFFVNTNSALIFRGINKDINSVYAILLNIFQLVGELITILLLGAFLIKTDWFIALFAMLLAGICFLIVVGGFKNIIKDAGKKSRLSAGEKNKYSFQAINGIKEIMVLNRRDYFINQYRKAADSSAKASLINSFVAACPDRILEGFCIGGIIGIVCVRVAMGVDIDSFVPVLGSFAMAAFKILPSISKVSSRINSIVYNQPGLNSCYENIIEAQKLEKENAPLCTKNEAYKSATFTNTLYVKNIVFKYQNSSENVLDGLSLEIKKGESVAFIGTSGAGKTTLADIIMGLFVPQSGYIEMDGVNICTIPNEWRHIVGYVPQSVFLIDDTIRSNIAFGLPNEEISDAKIWSALEKAQLKGFVEELPNKLDTIVGERGVKFSGGQRQRVAIARALYENPDILVLDEATSALDTETEKAVMESIEALHGQKTLIIVAHRLTTIKQCDRIFEIVNGRARIKDKSELMIDMRGKDC